MTDIREKAIKHLQDEYNAGEYAEKVLDWFVDMAIFTPMSSGYYYNSEHFDIDQDVINNIINIIKKEVTA